MGGLVALFRASHHLHQTRFIVNEQLWRKLVNTMPTIDDMTLDRVISITKPTTNTNHDLEPHEICINPGRSEEDSGKHL